MLKLLAHAKINLTLDILGKRPDGYHEVSMVMQEIDLADELTIEKHPNRVSLTIEGNPDLANDDSNLAVRAAKLFFEETDISGGCAIGRRALPHGRDAWL